MVFDLALGGLVLMAAFRGWLKGFVVQAIRIGGLLAAVFVAVPVRDGIKPYAIAYLPTIRPDLVDRLFWWASAIVSYFVIVGVASLIVATSRRQQFGFNELDRNDQFAGFGLGLVKGVLVAAFLVAAIHKYAQGYLEKIPYAVDQTKESMAWYWNERYHPAARVWATTPVQQLVNHIQRMGCNKPSEATEQPSNPVQTASRTPNLSVPGGPPLSVDPELRHMVESLQAELRALDVGK
jgi:uncharacterized membrane protein required for colicin V production